MHSSSEPEVHSALEVTETDTSDLFHTVDSVPIAKEPIVCTVQFIRSVLRVSIFLYSLERSNFS